MQQRRGTAAQWTSANPILASGEIGFESDTSKFKIGDGVNHWADLIYFASAAEIADLIDGAPELLDTLNELAAAVGDDPSFFTTVASNLSAHSSDTTSVHGIANTADLATTAQVETNIAAAITTATGSFEGYADSAVSAHSSDTTNVHGIANTADLAYAQDLADDIEAHRLTTTDIHGIADTTELATKDYVGDAITNSATDFSLLAGNGIDWNTVDGQFEIDSTIATESYADSAASSAVSTAISSLTSASVGLGNVDNTSDANKPVSTATQTALDAKLASSTAASTYAPIESPTFTGTVAGITKSMVGLANVDNTSDANKPVSTATQTALDLKAPKAAPTFTGTLTAADVTISGNLTVSGTTTTVNTTNFTTSDPVIYLGDGNNANLVDIGFVGSYNDGTYAHQGLVKDSSDGKWKLFKGVTDEPTTTVNFTQGSLDDLAVGALTATTVTPSSGVVFTDGTQTKEGVISRTPIVQKTASYTLSALTERDSLIEVSSASAVTVTVPPNSSVAYPVGTSIDILQTGAGQITVAAGSGVTINATPGLKLRTQWSGATLFKRATDTWVLYGDLTA